MRISATPLIQAYQGGTFFYRCYAVHQSTADHSGSDFTSSEQRTHNKRCRKGRVRIEKYQLLPLGDICIDYGIDQATYISSPVCLWYQFREATLLHILFKSRFTQGSCLGRVWLGINASYAAILGERKRILTMRIYANFDKSQLDS